VYGDKVDAIEAQIATTTQVNEPKLVAQKKSLTLSEKRKKYFSMTVSFAFSSIKILALKLVVT
tara:strand:+ start:1411 stop:1599 length:189 start_codon:yes stop_codon:yes gene_type:complete